jgi:hypothetical protein
MTLEIELPLPIVRICKIAEIDGAISPAGNPTDYQYGAVNVTSSLPVEYVLEGWLL